MSEPSDEGERAHQPEERQEIGLEPDSAGAVISLKERPLSFRRVRMEEGGGDIVKTPAKARIVKIDDRRAFLLNDDVARMQIRVDEPESVGGALACGEAAHEPAGRGGEETLVGARQTPVSPEPAPA